MIRHAVAADADAIARVHERAFGDEGPLIADLVGLLQRHPCGRDGLSFVAEADGRVVGHVLVTRSRLDCLPATIDVGVLSPLAVDPDLQGRGIGADLAARAREETEAIGLPLLFVEGDPAYYSRNGFQPARPLGFRKPSIRIPDAAFQVIRLPAYEVWMSGTLVYAEPFWDLDCVGLRDPGFLTWLAGEIAEGREI